MEDPVGGICVTLHCQKALVEDPGRLQRHCSGKEGGSKAHIWDNKEK